MADGDGVRVHRVYHGIDLGLFGTNGESRPPGPPYSLLTVARLTAKKGLPTVFEAVRLLRDQGLDVRHTLIGDGDDRDEILALIKRLGLEDAVDWLGTQPHEVVLEHYRRAHAFMLGCEIAANGDRDGIPNVLLESMAMGVPVAATETSGIPELVGGRRYRAAGSGRPARPAGPGPWPGCSPTRTSGRPSSTGDGPGCSVISTTKVLTDLLAGLHRSADAGGRAAL